MVDPMIQGDPEAISGYVLRGRLGYGGMGIVYLSATRGGQPVAIKTVRPDLAMDPRFRQRFEQEVGAARRVRGRYIANVLDSNTEGPMPWLATEFIPGASLDKAIATHGMVPIRTCLGVAAGVARALETIHAARIIHRDLKPGNVILTPDDLSVIDFGIARALDAAPLTGANTQAGTPAFMAPEQFRSDPPVTSAADVFSLGLTLHVAASGVHPFRGQLNAAIPYLEGGEPDLSACPDVLRPLIGPCLAMDPARRPTATEVVAMSQDAARRCGLTEVFPAPGWLPEQYTVVSVPAPNPPPAPAGTGWSPPPPPPPPARAWKKQLAVGTAVLAAAGIAAFAVWNGGSGGDGRDLASDSPPAGQPTAPETPADPDSEPDVDSEPDLDLEPDLDPEPDLGPEPDLDSQPDPDPQTEDPEDGVEEARRLIDRVKNGLQDCRHAADLYKIDEAQVTLSCTPRHGAGQALSEAEANSITVRTASFPAGEWEVYGTYDAFLDGEWQKSAGQGEWDLREDPSAIVLNEDDFPYWGPVENDEGIEIGKVFTHDGVLSSTIGWTFENDYFVSSHGEYFVIMAESKDREALVRWWNSWPV